MEEVYDLTVVGAGWYGLAVAATYLQVHPTTNILVLEAQATVGGVWSQERQYPDLKSNNMLGTYEYPGFAMDTETYGVKAGEHIPGHVIHRYLNDYAKKTGVFSRIRFNTKVFEASAETSSEGWTLRTDNHDLLFLRTSQLVVATGLTSTPFIPAFDGEEVFKKSGLLTHSRNFPQHTDRLFNKTSTVTVLGGSKSAWDVAYACASRNVPVNLVVRSSGQGPTWMAPPYVTPVKAWLEKLVHRRFLTWLSPCIWGDEDGFGSVRNFLHGSWLGRKLVDAFWWVLSTDANALMGYDKHPETAKLKPRNSAFWTGSGLGILNFDGDFLGLVREGKVKVHIADVVKLGQNTVSLSDGTSLDTDALVCATGWKARPPMTFLPEGIDATIGLPYSPPTTPQSLFELAEADEEILSRFPQLKDQPPTPIPGGDMTADATTLPFTLYRFMAPPGYSPRSTIAFAGVITTISTSLCASLQALWITAYLSNSLTRVPISPVLKVKSAVLHSRFGRWRYPCGHGGRFPDFVFDAVPYLDMLCKDLGLESRRKGSLWKEVFEAYGPEDYKGIVEEWIEKERR
ncbi:dimethylaniline monooxygenase (N-oxide forming), partial [Aureobasidium melanogenum]|uniref:Dimethylaniline monooxygenase (N-oxide forming) n=1 Tax=Aureobasidium melanogenum (strain CBS 110374) TaxID=1043003 RepID=A0A074VL95_AURM1